MENVRNGAKGVSYEAIHVFIKILHDLNFMTLNLLQLGDKSGL